MKTDWNSNQYLQYEDLRTRPAHELLSRVGLDNPKSIMDLGCGPGNSTELLTRRFQNSVVTGLDSSPNMLAEARERLPGADFIEGDIISWAPDTKVDLIFANASLQWVRNHGKLISDLVDKLVPSGVLAVQMPDNLDEPTHRLMRQVAEEGPWSKKLAEASIQREKIGSFADYYNYLSGQCDRIDIWSTSYAHILDSAEAIVEWVSSTGLRPYLSPLDEEEKSDFLKAYLRELKKAYPPMRDGKVILEFPRLFVVAQKKIC
ncbi:trans-aconitate 2-methyltransferase [Rhodospirillales bacterium 47_12_T64]|nr:trans-aconitate 2-methyltransferase [Rhodospirillales bacterium 47_12_T64]